MRARKLAAQIPPATPFLATFVFADVDVKHQRAEAVATALTNVFDIPPENMETQGYGEQYYI